jgi:hypothetical protein
VGSIVAVVVCVDIALGSSVGEGVWVKVGQGVAVSVGLVVGVIVTTAVGSETGVAVGGKVIAGSGVGDTTRTLDRKGCSVTPLF